MFSAVSTRRIFLARHGNRQDLVDPTWGASAEEPLDPPLAADGVEQARRLGQRLAGEGIVAIVASPYLRAVQTAHHVNETLGVPMYIEPGFAEWISPAAFERAPRLRSLEALRAEYPDLLEGYVASGALRHPESAEQLRQRTRQALDALLRAFDGNALAVGHAASVAATVLSDDSVTSVECPLCALYCLEHDGARWRLTIDAEVAHVGARLATFRFP
jgi:broad specificity phosphatase PhoE